jgi:CheY-like chemotaxis protein
MGLVRDDGAIARIILRAEIAHAGGVVVTHTLDVTNDTVTVASPAVVALGDRARIVLSFPGLIETFEVVARATGASPADGHGHPASLTFTVEEATAGARLSLAKIASLNRRDTPSSTTIRAAQKNASYRCLLVEDNAFIRDLFAYAVQKYGRERKTGLSLELAEDAETAWAKLCETGYDIAIIDHYLPLQTGSQLIARMRKEARFNGVPIIAISVGGDEARAESLAAGADLFLDKPIVMRDLFSTLDRLAVRR